MAAAGPTPSGPLEGHRSAWLDLAFKVLGSLLTAGGFLSFVVATGGAITWVRFYVAELPADQALAALPRHELLVTGSVSVGAFFVLGLLALATVYAIDAGGRQTAWMGRGLIVLTTEGMVIAIIAAPDPTKERVVAGALVVLIGLASLLAIHPPESESQPWRWIGKNVRDRLTSEAELPLTAEEKRAEESAPKRRKLTLTGYAVALVVMGACAGLLQLWMTWWVIAALVLAIFLAALCLGVSVASGSRFLPYGIAVVISIALFGAALNLIRAWHSPQVQPAALLRTGDSLDGGLEALYITENDERVYLGSVEQVCAADDADTNRAVSGSGRIFWVPRSQVVLLAIGDLQTIPDARERAPGLLTDLRALRTLEAEGAGARATITADEVKRASTDKHLDAAYSNEPRATGPAIRRRCDVPRRPASLPLR